jgi:hypothetical protein
VELDGPHHFQVTGYSRITVEQQLIIDVYDKMVPGLREDFSFLRIPQVDFLACYAEMKGPLCTLLHEHQEVEIALMTLAVGASPYVKHWEMLQ